MDPAQLSDFYFVYEPIVKVTGRVLGFEMLTRRHQSDTALCDAEHLFSMLPAQLKTEIFSEQVNIVASNAAYLRGQHVHVSLNVDVDIAEFIARSPSLKNTLRRLPFLRLEINEHFPELYLPCAQPLLTQLASCCALWLDDFGSVNYPIQQPQHDRFECIKLDKHYFWQYQDTESLSEVIQQLNQVCRGVIVEGIETPAQRKGLMNQGILGMQGYLWPARVQHKESIIQ